MVSCSACMAVIAGTSVMAGTAVIAVNASDGYWTICFVVAPDPFPGFHDLLPRTDHRCGGRRGDCLINVDLRLVVMTIPFAEPEPSDALLNKSVSSTRLRAWLNTRLRQLASAQRIQDARALRSEFSIE